MPCRFYYVILQPQTALCHYEERNNYRLLFTFPKHCGCSRAARLNCFARTRRNRTNTAVAKNLLPYTVSVVGSERLEATGSTQVLSAISGMVPSLFVSERSIFGFGVSNGGSGHIKLRGVGGDRASAVLMMVDGQPQFAGIYSHHISDFYDKEYVERVEVLRGPGRCSTAPTPWRRNQRNHQACSS